MTSEQIEEAKALIGKMPKEEIAVQVGVSTANLKRAFRGTRLAFHNKYVINPDLVRRVCLYYEVHGLRKTQDNFPNIRVRSVVERYKQFKPRQIRWQPDQILELVKMSGLISKEDQWKYFKRPRAYAGSIGSFWMKNMGFSGASIHGMSNHMAKELVKDTCPRVKTKYWSNRMGNNEFSRKICLWVDMERHLRRGAPKFIREAITSLAEFQRWVFNSKNPKPEILKIIKDRSMISNGKSRHDQRKKPILEKRHEQKAPCR